MTERDVKIVVAEGPSGRKGLLRFVLESEGYHVVGEASSPADLARALETHHPDVVVLDDGIGATAVGMTHDLEPAAKVILVWPEAVVPIGGDAAVEPSSVLRRLGPAVERLTGVPSATGRMGVGTGVEAAGILSLGAILAMGRAGGSPSTTPADIPEPAPLDPAEPIIDDRGAAPVLILPEDAETIPGPLTLAELAAAEQLDPAPASGVGAVAGVAALAGAAAGAAGAAGASAGASSAARNRRIGTLALGGAALAGSLVLALALSGSRVPIGGVRGEAPSFTSPPPVAASPVIPPPRAVAIPGALLGDLGGGDTTLTLVNTSAVAGTGPRVPSDGNVPLGGGGGGNSGGTPTPPTGGSGGGSGGPGSGGGGGGSGGSGGGGTGSGGGSGGSTGGGALLGDGGDGQDGGGDACVPDGDDATGEHHADGENAGQPCETDGLDGHHHDDGDDQQGDDSGEHGYSGGDQQGDGDQGNGCDEHDGFGDHDHEGGDGYGDVTGYGDSGDHDGDQGDGA